MKLSPIGWLVGDQSGSIRAWKELSSYMHMEVFFCLTCILAEPFRRLAKTEKVALLETCP